MTRAMLFVDSNGVFYRCIRHRRTPGTWVPIYSVVPLAAPVRVISTPSGPSNKGGLTGPFAPDGTTHTTTVLTGGSTGIPASAVGVVGNLVVSGNGATLNGDGFLTLFPAGNAQSRHLQPQRRGCGLRHLQRGDRGTGDRWQCGAALLLLARRWSPVAVPGLPGRDRLHPVDERRPVPDVGPRLRQSAVPSGRSPPVLRGETTSLSPAGDRRSSAPVGATLGWCSTSA